MCYRNTPRLKRAAGQEGEYINILSEDPFFPDTLTSQDGEIDWYWWYSPKEFLKINPKDIFEQNLIYEYSFWVNSSKDWVVASATYWGNSYNI